MNAVKTWLFLGLVACGGAKKYPITVGEQAIQVELALDDEQRAKGLMHRDSLDTDSGMLFIYPDVKPRSFWMKNTRIPLSIAYADARGKIVKISDMKPFSISRVPSLYPAKYALEMNIGWFETHGIEVGDSLGGLDALPEAQ